MKKQVLLLSIPLMEIKKPSPAIYHLKGQLEANGVTVKSVDVNILTWQKFEKQWDDIIYMLQWHNAKPTWELYEPYLNQIKKIVNDSIIETDPDWIGISIFSLNSRRTGIDILKHIRSCYPDKKLIIGGCGLGDALGDKQYDYAAKLLKKGLIDYYLPGEAEASLVELIANDNTTYPGINSPPVQISNLENIAFANYDDCKHEQYPFADFDSGLPTYVLTGSRGCVRRCDFCDIYRLWPKFKTRGGDHVAKEMIYHYERRGVYNFYFSDSLVNGSMKAFRDLVDTLLKYKEDHAVDFRWGGQFICRTNRQMSTEDYMMASAAGLENVGIGLEHASERIRKFMRKGFDDGALEDTIRNLDAGKIHAVLNFIAGHPMETEDDHNENIKFLHDYQWASQNGTIAALNLQHYIAFLPGTDFNDNRDNLVETDVGTFWKSKHVNTLDFPEIFRRRKHMSDMAKEIGWNMLSEEAFMNYMERELLLYEQQKNDNIEP